MRLKRRLALIDRKAMGDRSVMELNSFHPSLRPALDIFPNIANTMSSLVSISYQHTSILRT